MVGDYHAAEVVKEAMPVTQRLIGVLFVVLVGTAAAQAQDLTPRQIYERAASSVVLVLGYSQDGERGSGGTGSIIGQGGLVLTNAHVVVEARTGRPFPRLFVYLKPDRVTGHQTTDLSRRKNATVVAFSQGLDLAVLKLERPATALPVLEVGDSDKVRIGDPVVAIGHPEQGGLWTLTTGVVSAEFHDFNKIKGKHVFQTETGLNRGNSGGPLLNTEGQMIGVNSAIARVAADGTPITSISFALKSNVASNWLKEQRIRGQAQTGVRAHTGSRSRPSETSITPKAPTPEPHSQSRPYDLDQLISERSRIEAELEDMIEEMRGRTRRR